MRKPIIATLALAGVAVTLAACPRDEPAIIDEPVIEEPAPPPPVTEPAPAPPVMEPDTLVEDTLEVE